MKTTTIRTINVRESIIHGKNKTLARICDHNAMEKECGKLLRGVGNFMTDNPADIRSSAVAAMLLSASLIGGCSIAYAGGKLIGKGIVKLCEKVVELGQPIPNHDHSEDFDEE